MHLLNMCAVGECECDQTVRNVLIGRPCFIFIAFNPHERGYTETISAKTKTVEVASSKSILDFLSGIFSRFGDAHTLWIEHLKSKSNYVVVFSRRFKVKMIYESEWLAILCTHCVYGVTPVLIGHRAVTKAPATAQSQLLSWKFEWNRSHSHSISNLIKNQRHACHPLQHKRAHVHGADECEQNGECVFTSK